MNRRCISLCFVFLFTTSMIGQELPRGFDKDELFKMPEYLTEVFNYTPLHHIGVSCPERSEVWRNGKNCRD
jgi:hypothetical protein